MTTDEIIHFSRALNMSMLMSYREAVGKRTRAVIKALSPPDLKRKVKPEIARVLDEGGVIEHKDSIWLLDFWGKKTVAGILLMPITRHQIMHLNNCLQMKEKIMIPSKK